VLWSSEDPRYGGHGTPEAYDVMRGFFVPGQSALVLAPLAVAPGAGAAKRGFQTLGSGI
jgi:hypothetical protein